MNEKQTDYRTSAQVGKVFNLSSKRVQQLTADGILETVETSKGRRYDWDRTVEMYVAYLSAKAYGREQKQSIADLEEKKLKAEVEAKQAKAAAVTLELKELQGKMHRAEDVEAITTDHVLYLRSLLMAMPGKLAVDCANCKTPAEAAARIQQEVYGILNNLADYRYDPEEYKRRVRERNGWDDISAEQGDPE